MTNETKDIYWLLTEVSGTLLQIHKTTDVLRPLPLPALHPQSPCQPGKALLLLLLLRQRGSAVKQVAEELPQCLLCV